MYRKARREDEVLNQITNNEAVLKVVIVLP